MDQRKHLTADQLLSSTMPDHFVDNHWFVPVGDTTLAAEPLMITLALSATEMRCNQPGVDINGKRIDLFPGVTLGLTNAGNQLVPLQRNLLRDDSAESYWDITVSPGEIWREAEDGPWSRAALPFQLSNILENDSHHGIATFLYQQNAVSAVYLQIVCETKAFVAPEHMVARGFVKAGLTALDDNQRLAAINCYQQEVADQHPLLPLDQWRNSRTERHFDEIENGFGSNGHLICGVIADDKIYCTPCKTTCGEFPYPRGLKFGVWSVTKTAFCFVACMRMSQVTGEDPRKALIADLIAEAVDNPDWHRVTIGDCLNMATGIGTAGTAPTPPDAFADYLLDFERANATAIGGKSYDHYFDWFLAPSQHQKNIAALACPRYSWEPGEITRYRDQDLYLAGAALDAWLKRKQGPQARIWDLVRDEVYIPAGIHHAVNFHTIETDTTREVPLSDAGLLLSMDNVAALGRLLHNGGKLAGQQILDANMIEEVFNPSQPKGLATGQYTADGEIHYHGSTWHLPYRSNSGNLWWIPTMRGYGGQLIQTLPNRTTVFRFGFDSYATDQRYDNLTMARLSDDIFPF